MKTNLLSKLTLTLVLSVAACVSFAQQTIVYTDSFRTNIASTAAQKTTWDNFRASLTTNHCWTSIQIKGTFNAAGITTSNAATVTNIANALRTGTVATYTFGANTWRIGAGCAANSIELTCNTTTCACGAGNSIRPGQLSTAWGGVNTQICNGPSQRITLIFTYNGTPIPSPVTGPNSVCTGTTQTYTCDTVASATSYNWTVPAGATILSGQGTTSISVQWGANSGRVKVYANGNCGPSTIDSTMNVTVNAYPVVSQQPFATVCDNVAPFTLSGGNPAGGTYTGPGVTNNVFDPVAAGPGTHSITYSVTTNGCTSTTSQTITVYTFTPATLNPFVQNCSYTPPYQLGGGFPGGGVYSGTGVSNGIFSPQAAGVGTHMIYYTYTSAFGCVSVDSQAIVVNAQPTVTFAPLNAVCVDAGAMQLTGGSPAGGIYYGNGITNGVFDPMAAGVGVHTITYIYTDNTTCSDTAVQTIVVNPLPLVTFGAISSTCESAPAFLLNTGAPAGGVYSGPGVNNGLFDPAMAGAGGHTITYTYTDGNGCSNSAYQTVIILQAPNVTLPSFVPNPVCMDSLNEQNSITLNGGLPSGGNYIGNGVVANAFYPILAGVGNHVITYIFTNGFGCTDTAQRTISVMNCTGIEETIKGASASVYPNPNSGDFTLSVVLESSQVVDVVIANTLGQTIYRSEENLPSGTSLLPLSIGNYEKGVYFLQIRSNAGVVTKHIVIE